MKRLASIALCLMMMLTSVSQITLLSFAAETPNITCESKECNPGDTVTVKVNLNNNPGIMYLEITPTCSSELGKPTVQNGSIISDLTQGKQYLWVADNDVTENGTLVTMTFNVAESIAPGDYSVGFIFRSAFNYDEEPVPFTVVPATICVKAKPVSVTGFALDKTEATVETGDETLTLTPFFSPENATNKNLIWTSDNERIATIAGGVVTLLKKGVVTITATTEDGGYSASCVVTINCSHRKGNHYPAESSTCIKQGHEAYDLCEECGEIINGSDAKLPLADHTYIEKVDVEYLKSAATCVSKAVYYKSCSVCCKKSDVSFFEYGEFDINNHIGGTYKSNQKEATCYEKGYTGDTYCAGCNMKLESGAVIKKNAHNPASVWSTDESYHWKDCQTVGCGNIIDKAAHSGGTATCTKKAICSVCGVEYGEVDAENHINTELRNAVAATCTENGYTGDTYCKDCGVKIAEGTVIPAGHTLVKVEAKETTHEADGNIEYFKCFACGKLFADAEATREITLEDTVMAKGEHDYGDTYQFDSECHWKECGCGNIAEKVAHTYGSWTILQEATETEKGSKEHICSACGYKVVEEIPAVNTATAEPANPAAPSPAPIPSEKPDASDGNTVSVNKTPQTGDNANVIFWIALFAVSGVGLTIAIVCSKKRRVR